MPAAARLSEVMIDIAHVNREAGVDEIGGIHRDSGSYSSQRGILSSSSLNVPWRFAASFTNVCFLFAVRE